MSTYMYLECTCHNPPLQASEESGQHYRDLRDIFDDIDNRDEVVSAVKRDMLPADTVRRNTALFLADHPRCDIQVISEYDVVMTREDIPDNE